VLEKESAKFLENGERKMEWDDNFTMDTGILGQLNIVTKVDLLPDDVLNARESAMPEISENKCQYSANFQTNLG